MLGKGRLGRWIPRLAVVLAVVLTQPAGAAPGDLDPSFATDGLLAVPQVGPFVARAVTIDAADRIVVAGYLCERSEDATCLKKGDTNARVARLTPDGGPDYEFGDRGVVTTVWGEGRSQAYDVLALPDGSIVAAGVASVSGRGVMALARYAPDGALDPDFGDGGIALLSVGSGYASARKIEPGPRGTLLVAGQAADAGGKPRMAIARVTTTGALDPTFGVGGVALGGTGNYGYGLALGVSKAGAPFVAGLAGDAFEVGYRFAELSVSATGTPLRAAEHRVGARASYANAMTLLPGGDFLSAGGATTARGRAAMATVRGDLAGRRVKSRLFPLGDGATANDVLPDPTGGAWLIGQVQRGDAFRFGTVRLDGRGALERVTEISWDGYPVARAIAGALQRSGRLVTVGLGCANGLDVSCEGGTPTLLIARQFGGTLRPTVKAPRSVSRAGLRRGLRVTVRLPVPARVDARLLSHGRLLRQVRTSRPHPRVRLRLRADARRGPLRLVVRCGRRSVTRVVRLRG